MFWCEAFWYARQTKEDIEKDGVGDKHMCMNSPEGLTTALFYYFCGDEDVMNWLATVCSTWIFYSRHATGRSDSKPMGDASFGGVTLANKMVARSGFIMALSYIMIRAYGLEQPHNSLMKEHDTLVLVKDVCAAVAPFRAGPMVFQWHEIPTYMGCFGADRPKKTEIIANWQGARQLTRRIAESGRSFPSLEESGIGFIRSDGRGTGLEGVKQTQAYTVDFAMAVYNAWKVHWADIDRSDFDVQVPLRHVLPAIGDQRAKNAWAIAEFGESLDLFRGRI